MKKIFTLFTALMVTVNAWTQAPEKMSYQSVVRDADNNLVINQTVGMQISILQGSSGGSAVYVETHNPGTNVNGLVAIKIGDGSAVSGDFDSIDWSDGPFFLKTEVDPEGGTDYSITGTSELLSVPFARFADQAGNAFSGNYDDLANLPERWDSTYSSIKNRPDLSAYATKDMGNESIINLGDPVNAKDAVNKQYVDSSSASGWSLSGNSGTDPATDFIGTIDEHPLVFRVNNTEKMRLDSTGGLSFSGTGNSLFIGQATGMHDDLSDNMNVFIGDSTGYNNASGQQNTAGGYKAFYSNESGNNNTGLGYKALSSNVSGFGNTGIGVEALSANVGGGYNTGLGLYALRSNTTGTKNTATGINALMANTNGHYNTAIGADALFYNQQGMYNTAMGNNALRYNRSSSNTAVGAYALIYNTTGHSNVALGTKALLMNSDRSNLVAVGDSALFYNGYGASATHHATSNTAVGSKTLFLNTTGYNNTGSGFHALYSNSTGAGNTAYGYNVLKNNTTGGYNTGVGISVLGMNTDGIRNTASGLSALGRNSSGNYNTAHGAYALHFNDGGHYNTAVGYYAGPYSLSYLNLSNTAAFGYNARVTADNTIRLGNSSITQIGGYAPWSNLSDGRFKTRVQDNVPGLDFVMQLRPVTFHWDLHALEDFHGAGAKGDKKPEFLEAAMIEKEKKVYTGFIAQEVEKAAKACGFDFSGIIRPQNQQSAYNLSYAEFVVPLVRALQQQQEQIAEQKKINEQQQQLIENLLEEINKLK
jgi:hypothetical protein